MRSSICHAPWNPPTSALRWTCVGNTSRTRSTAHVASLRLAHDLDLPHLVAILADVAPRDDGRRRASESARRHEAGGDQHGKRMVCAAEHGAMRVRTRATSASCGSALPCIARRARAVRRTDREALGRLSPPRACLRPNTAAPASCANPCARRSVAKPSAQGAYTRHACRHVREETSYSDARSASTGRICIAGPAGTPTAPGLLHRLASRSPRHASLAA
ncbi:hypothetical protein FA95DRAFT_1128814 [Auriscalpium vulgare]|uniref:Uncharacterized protein n=1 Tax=Auriscalpium vulgare TaxID=40419 RepID=A0ACB8R4Q9_9AGAM|nr:hypothetical protein FA95DRAFT_1128814 [Auriscalpium vulgare]